MSGLEFTPIAETHYVRSDHVDQTFKIEVMQPACVRGAPPETLPVIFATDGNRAFPMLKALSALLQASGHDAPPFRLVAIGYPTDSPRGGALLRVRDFTFPGCPRFPLIAPPVEGMLTAPAGTPTHFGAEAFLDFIERELTRFIDNTYPTAASPRTYFGHSGGGALGLYALLTRPHLFQNIIASSPSLAYEGVVEGVAHTSDEFLLQSYFDAFVASKPTHPSVHVYLSVGSAEENEPGLEPWRLVTNCKRFETLVRNARLPNLKLDFETLAGETHMTAWPFAFMHGVQAVFGYGRWAPSPGARHV